MWGGRPDRNMVSDEKGLPTEWDVKTKKNVKWMATLGSQSYGNPVVAGGMVFVGTNNDALRDPKQPGDRGVLLAFRESDGEFLWQMTSEKLAAGRVNDWPLPGRRVLAAGRRRPPVLREQPCRARLPGHQGLPGRRERRAVQGREAHLREGRRHRLEARHDRGGRDLPAQPGQLLAGLVRRPRLREHVERPRREPRQHPVPARARPHCRPQGHREARLAGQLRRATASCTGSGPPPPSAGSAAWTR